MSTVLDESGHFGHRVIQAYIHSNVYWPQTRASFVIVFLQSILLEDVVEIFRFEDASATMWWETASVISRADSLHKEYGIWTVHPTKPMSVQRELNQSCRVLYRTLSALSPAAGRTSWDATVLKISARNLWRWIRTSDFAHANKAFISDCHTNKFQAVKVPVEKNLNLLSFWSELKSSFKTGWEARIIDALEPEILHPITAIRSSEL